MRNYSWISCFTMYITVLAQNHPQSSPVSIGVHGSSSSRDMLKWRRGVASIRHTFLPACSGQSNCRLVSSWPLLALLYIRAKWSWPVQSHLSRHRLQHRGLCYEGSLITLILPPITILAQRSWPKTLPTAFSETVEVILAQTVATVIRAPHVASYSIQLPLSCCLFWSYIC